MGLMRPKKEKEKSFNIYPGPGSGCVHAAALLCWSYQPVVFVGFSPLVHLR
jgi:hypothetical protein